MALRRSSSRDEVWLSAADMYTLLTVSLLAAVAFGGTGLLRTVRSPTPSHSAIKLGPLARTTETAAEWFAEWEEGTTCSVRYVPAAGGESQYDPVPCVPAAFGGAGASATLQRHGREMGPKTVMRCLGGNEPAMLRCAKLMWTLIDAGFDPKLVVRQ